MPTFSSNLDLAVGIPTHNNARTIERSLQSLQNLATRVVIADSGSTDGTIELCQSYGAEVIPRDWPGHARQKQFLLDQCADHTWAMLIDSDESLEPELACSIRRVIEENDPTYDAWAVNRKVWFHGGWLHHCLQPEWRTRLARGGKGRMKDLDHNDGKNIAMLHDAIIVDGQTGRLTGDLRHDSWENLADMCHRNINYGKLLASYDIPGGSLTRIMLSPPAAFLKQYLLKRGFLDGKRGLICSGGVAAGVLMKHLFIALKKSNLDPDSGE